jgi:hypothetical protein
MIRTLLTITVALLAVVTCGGSGAEAYCDVIKRTVAESPNQNLKPQRQVQVLRELERVAPEELRSDLAVYRSEAQLIAIHPEQVRSFPEAIARAFDHLSSDAKSRCGTDPFSAASPDAPNVALTLTVSVP